jgi:hypothetical protein
MLPRNPLLAALALGALVLAACGRSPASICESGTTLDAAAAAMGRDPRFNAAGKELLRARVCRALAGRAEDACGGLDGVPTDLGFPSGVLCRRFFRSIAFYGAFASGDREATYEQCLHGQETTRALYGRNIEKACRRLAEGISDSGLGCGELAQLIDTKDRHVIESFKNFCPKFAAHGIDCYPDPKAADQERQWATVCEDGRSVWRAGKARRGAGGCEGSALCEAFFSRSADACRSLERSAVRSYCAARGGG